MSEREQWGSRRGFILATIGAAVGIGNIWRFSYVAGENGGGTFLLVYAVCVILIGLPLVIAELSVGRRAQGDAVTAFETAGRSRGWGAVGWVATLGGVLILSYYPVIAGWALKYFSGAATGTLWAAASAGYGGYFQRFIANPGEPIAWQALMIVLCMLVVVGGVRRGIEWVNRWLMPLLGLIIVALALYASTLPGSGGGYAFLLRPDWNALADPQIYVAALGQAFFSIGLGMAIFVTYGSYMARAIPLPASAGLVVAGDTLFAVVAGLAIFPAVFAFGADPRAGPELAFITLPQVFLKMPGGPVIGTVFFFLLSAAALTSMVSFFEVVVAIAIQRFGLARWRATALVGTGIFVVGLAPAMSFGLLSGVTVAGRGILDTVDATVSNLILPVSAILVALFVGWRMERKVALAEAGFDSSWLGRVWLWLCRIPIPVAILIILLRSAERF